MWLLLFFLIKHSIVITSFLGYLNTFLSTPLSQDKWRCSYLEACGPRNLQKVLLDKQLCLIITLCISYAGGQLDGFVTVFVFSTFLHRFLDSCIDSFKDSLDSRIDSDMEWWTRWFLHRFLKKFQNKILLSIVRLLHQFFHRFLMSRIDSCIEFSNRFSHRFLDSQIYSCIDPLILT